MFIYTLFLQGVGQHGLPLSDQGRENVRVTQDMLHQGVQRRSVLVCNSIHNQKVSHCCYVNIFMKKNKLLDPIFEEMDKRMFLYKIGLSK